MTSRIETLFGSLVFLVFFLVLSAGVRAQSATSTRPAAPTAPTAPAAIPKEATTLQGSPTVRVDTTPEGTTRRQLTKEEADQHPLTINVVNGRYFWKNQPLTLRTSGEYTYLSSTQPGQYVRFSRINNRLTYVEHVDLGLGSVTFWGELRIVLGK